MITIQLNCNSSDRMTSLLVEMDAAAELKAVQEGYHELRVRAIPLIKEPLCRITTLEECL